MNFFQVNINPLGERLIDVIMEDYGESNKINFKQFIYLLAKFRPEKTKSTGGVDMNSRESKLKFLFDVRIEQFAPYDIRYVQYIVSMCSHVF
jgi:Ca2+-binding EF-hand superfamily protein